MSGPLLSKVSKNEIYKSLAISGIKRADEYLQMVDIAKQNGNIKMAEDLEECAYLENLRAELLSKGIIVQMIGVSV